MAPPDQTENHIKRENPYLGPRPYSRADAYRFFGRAKEAAELCSLVAAHRTVLLYSQSGAGKSSLLNAGTIPLLESRGFDVLPTARVSGTAETALPDANIYVFNCKRFWGNDTTPQYATLSSILSSRPARKDASGILPRVAVLDQFEELFTSYASRWQEREEFFTQLNEAMEVDRTLRVLFAMREDFVAHLDSFEELLPEELRTRFRLEQLRQQAALAAVEGPLGSTTVRFKEGVAKLLVSDLLTVPAAPGADARIVGEYVDPVQLQVVCFSLFRSLPEGTTEITQEHLVAFGDVDQALREFYVGALQDAAAITGTDEDSLRQWFETKLITESGSRGLVFRGDKTTGGIPNGAVDELEELHIIRPEVRGADRWYELSHDRFVQPILRANDAWRARVQKEQAAEEAAEHEKEAAQQRELEQAQALAYEQKLRAEAQAKSAKRLRQGLAVVAVLFALALATSYYAFHQAGVATEAVNRAIEAEKEALAASERAATQAKLEKQTLAQQTVGYQQELERRNKELAELYKQRGDPKRANQYNKEAEKNKQDAQAATVLASKQGKASAPLSPTEQSMFGLLPPRSTSQVVPLVGHAPVSPLSSPQPAAQPGPHVKHLIVLMMENRSFDHMLGSLKMINPEIDGLTGNESNPDSNGTLVRAQPSAVYQGQLDPDPDYHFPGVDFQIFGGDATSGRVANMQGFVKSYFIQFQSIERSRSIMYYFKPDKLPVLTTLATEFAVCDRWFSSVPGPTIPNRAFAHYGTSFGQVGMNILQIGEPYKSIFERMVASGHTAKIYYYDQVSSTMEVASLLQHHPEVFGTYQQFLSDVKRNTLPEYSFVEPNYNDHDGDNGQVIANDDHPDHHVGEGERFIASVYNAISTNEDVWNTSILLITYSNHGGIYDHVPPPAATPDGFVASPDQTGTGKPFAFDRLGVRVPTVIVSPYIPKGTVDHTVYDHASIPATVSKLFLSGQQVISPREGAAHTFDRVLTLKTPRPDSEMPFFHFQ